MSARDWADPNDRPTNDAGSKAQVGIAKSSYSEWRRTVGHGCYANDVDWLEWRSVNGELRVVAVIETTFYEDKPELRHLLESYCRAALDRFKRDGQYRVTKAVAAAFGVPAYFVVMRYDLEVFFVCRLRDEAWKEMSEGEYRRWLMRLGAAALPKGGE